MTEKAFITWQWMVAAIAAAGIGVAAIRPEGLTETLTNLVAPVVGIAGFLVVTAMELMKTKTREALAKGARETWRDLTDVREWTDSLVDLLGLLGGWLIGVYLAQQLDLIGATASFLALICALVGQQVTAGLLKKPETTPTSQEMSGKPDQRATDTAGSTNKQETSTRPPAQKRRRKSNTRERRS